MDKWRGKPKLNYNRSATAYKRRTKKVPQILAFWEKGSFIMQRVYKDAENNLKI